MRDSRTKRGAIVRRRPITSKAGRAAILKSSIDGELYVVKRRSKIHNAHDAINRPLERLAGNRQSLYRPVDLFTFVRKNMKPHFVNAASFLLCIRRVFAVWSNSLGSNTFEQSDSNCRGVPFGFEVELRLMNRQA